MENGQEITKPALDVETSPTIGVPTYAGASNFQESPALDARKPLGNGHDTTVYHEGETPIVTVKDADVKNSDKDIVQNISASEENLSAKYKYPNRSQDTGIMDADQK